MIGQVEKLAALLDAAMSATANPVMPALVAPCRTIAEHILAHRHEWLEALGGQEGLGHRVGGRAVSGPVPQPERGSLEVVSYGGGEGETG